MTGAPRLSPNALPPATAGRFVLLIATALAGSAYIYGWLASRLDAVGDLPAVCARMAQGAPQSMAPDALVAWYTSCSRWASLMTALVIAVMIAVFVAVTIGIYLAWPYAVRDGLSPAQRIIRHDAALSLLRDMVVRHGGGRRIRLWIDLAGPSRAFGHFGAYHIAVNIADLKALAGDAPARGVVLHELAHIRNRDVDLTYLAVAVWWGYLAAVLLPFTLVAVNAPGLLLDFGWRAAAMLAVLWVVRAGVLRTREHYADVMAAAGDVADEDAVIAYLHGLSRPASRWWRWYAWANHPSAADREAALRDGRALFSLDARVAVATGLLVGIAYTPAYYLLTLILPDGTYVRGWLCGVVFGLLIAAVLGGSVWRATLASLARDAPAHPTSGRSPRTWRQDVLIVAVFTAGLLAGQVLAPPILTVGSWGAVLSATALFAAVPAALLFGGGYLCLLWMRLTARSWLSVTGSPRWAYRVGLAQAAVVIGAWLAAWFQLVELSSTGQSWGILAFFAVSVVVNPAAVAAVIWAFGYAVAAWQTRRMAQRRRAYPFWRFGVRAELPAEPPTGLGHVYAVTAGALLAYSVMERLYYGRLREHMAAANGTGSAGLRDMFVIVAILLVPAIFVGVVAAVVLGFLAGGRGRTGAAACTAGLGLMLIAVVLFVAALFHLKWASPITQDPLTLLRGLSGWRLLGPLPDDRPEPSLGVTVSALFMLMLVPGLLAAVAGSAARSLVTRRPPAKPRRLWAAALQATPLLLVAAVLIGLTASEWNVRPTIALPDAVNQGTIDAILAQSRPGSLTRDQACSGLYAEFADRRLASSTASGQLDTHLATAARLALSAQDPTLHTVGRSIADASSLAEVQQAARGVAVALQYCAAAGGLTPAGAS